MRRCPPSAAGFSPGICLSPYVEPSLNGTVHSAVAAPPGVSRQRGIRFIDGSECKRSPGNELGIAFHSFHAAAEVWPGR